MSNSPWRKRMENFDGFAKEKMDQWEIPGMAIAVIKDGEVILSGGYGFGNKNENLKATENTVFAIGSTSKAFTAVSAGILADEGQLEWDAPVKKYIPWFEMYDSLASERVTIRDILCHRTGLARHELMWYNSPFDRKELVKRIRYLQPSKDFRSEWQYQNLMIVAAGYLIEEITGKTWEQFVQERIFEPLGMTCSSFSVDKMQQEPDYSMPYKKTNGKIVEIPFRNVDTIGPAGSINSSVADMAKWVLLNMNKGKYNDMQIISQANLNQIYTPHMPVKTSQFSFKEIQLATYGMGWLIEAYRGHRLLSHTGGVDGFSSRVSFMPDENIGMVMLTNLDQTSTMTWAMHYEIYDRLLGYEGKDWNKEVRETVLKSMESLQKQKDEMLKSTGPIVSPSHPPEEYEGIYENPGYGTAEVIIEGQSMKLKYNNLTFTARHHKDNAFSLYFELWDQTYRAEFGTNENGCIDKLSIRFEPDPSVKDIVFMKK